MGGATLTQFRQVQYLQNDQFKIVAKAVDDPTIYITDAGQYQRWSRVLQLPSVAHNLALWSGRRRRVRAHNRRKKLRRRGRARTSSQIADIYDNILYFCTTCLVTVSGPDAGLQRGPVLESERGVAVSQRAGGRGRAHAGGAALKQGNKKDHGSAG